MKRLFYLLAGLSVLSCTQEILPTDSSDEVLQEQAFYITTGDNSTKTLFVDNKLEWQENDAVGLFVADKLANKKFRCIEANKTSATFKGYYIPFESVANANIFAYYPYSERAYSEGKLNLTLPENQVAPFDPSADFVLARATRDYDKENPDLNLSFDNHIFSIVKLTFSNTNADYSDEDIYDIEITAPEGSILTGEFSIDPNNGKAAAPSFISGRSSNRVVISYPEGSYPKLGTGIEHTIYAVVNAGTYSGLKVSIRCSSHRSSFVSSETVNLEPNHIYNISKVFDFASGKQGKSTRTLLYWGDSIANDVVTSYLQTLLGDSWIVVRGGVGGDTPLGIAGRQGAIPLAFKDSFTIPGNGEPIEFKSALYSTWTTGGNPASNVNEYTRVSFDAWFQASSCSLINNCYVGEDKVECSIIFNTLDKKVYIRRMSAGADVNVTPGTILYSNASQTYPHPDVTCVYSGANRNYNNSYEALSRMYKAMKNYASDEFGNNNFVAIGFHMGHIRFSASDEYTYWTPEYSKCFQDTFGEQYLDLKTFGSQNAERISKAIGCPFTEEDRELSGNGYWTSSWQTEYSSNVHPNANGSKALAFMVYEKMKTLGYLD